MHPPDQYVVGDFDGDGRSELLAINPDNGWSHLMRYDGSGWQTPWDNDGSGTIHWWQLRPPDQYVVGDFDGDNHSELLAINTENGWAHLMRYDGSDWQPRGATTAMQPSICGACSRGTATEPAASMRVQQSSSRWVSTAGASCSAITCSSLSSLTLQISTRSVILSVMQRGTTAPTPPDWRDRSVDVPAAMELNGSNCRAALRLGSGKAVTSPRLTSHLCTSWNRSSTTDPGLLTPESCFAVIGDCTYLTLG